MALIKGERAKFIEHASTITDIDSGGDTRFTEGCLLKEGIEDPEHLTNKIIKNRHGWMFGGNALEMDYCGETGRTVICEVQEHPIKPGKLCWVTVEELTERTMDFEEMSQIG